MSTTSGVNVLRYSALCFGVIYGFYHQRKITSSQRTAAAQREYEHKEKLIAEAKKAYAKSKQPVVQTQSGGFNQDPNDPNFDLGAYIEAFLGQKA